ncbi:MAG: hypothetical protein COV99_11290 [Bacteroidetes bacterium CG12_big_fil_rev_8_21_14_0_65_60_17]|nr:MAG: hypothetical protein COV99_11290 [Bacteroidetes bacterium CG12_big_fil_rev_8_21_14_0_65_60_17]
MAKRRSISTRTRSKTKRTETSAPSKRTARFVKASSAKQNGATRSRAVRDEPARAARPRTRSRRTAAVRNPEEVTWKDLATDNEKGRSAAGRASTVMGGVSTVRFVAGVLAVLVLVTLYVGHVHATRGLTQAVQELRRERLELQLELNRVSGDYERKTGHTNIASRARGLGLVEAVPEGKPIVVDP